MKHAAPGSAALLALLALTPLAASAHGGEAVHVHGELLLVPLLVAAACGLLLLAKRRGPLAVRLRARGTAAERRGPEA